MGGLKNRHYVDTEEVTIVPPSSPEDVKNLLAQAIVDVRAKRLDPRSASTITYMSSTLLKAFETTDLEQRLARLEEESRAKTDKPSIHVEKGCAGSVSCSSTSRINQLL
jgi:hypothetical protein